MTFSGAEEYRFVTASWPSIGVLGPPICEGPELGVTFSGAVECRFVTASLSSVGVLTKALNGAAPDYERQW